MRHVLEDNGGKPPRRETLVTEGDLRPESPTRDSMDGLDVVE